VGCERGGDLGLGGVAAGVPEVRPHLHILVKGELVADGVRRDVDGLADDDLSSDTPDRRDPARREHVVEVGAAKNARVRGFLHAAGHEPLRG
jgi:hypothetical protein